MAESYPEILRRIADEYDRTAAAKAPWAAMAENNARRPNLPASQVDMQLQAAERARTAHEHFLVRAKAARAGAEALEAQAEGEPS